MNRPATLALLRFVTGSPLDRRARHAPEVGGDLLGRVHAILLCTTDRSWVPGRLLDWCRSHAGSGSVDRDGALESLDAIERFEESVGLTSTVLYGDPSPEILVDTTTGSVGLIDWGTPSWGPVLRDIACWLAFLSRDSHKGVFVAAYRRHVPLRDGELTGLPLFRRLGSALALLLP